MEEDKTLNDDQLEDNQEYDDTTTEVEVEEEDEGGESDSVTLTRAEREQLIADTRKEQDKRWKDRLKGVEGNEGSKKDTEKGSPKEENKVIERLNKAELRAEGIKDSEQQAKVLELAGKLGIEDMTEALQSPAIKAELKVLQNKASTPPPTTRTATGQRDEVSYWAAQTEKGKRAPTAEMRTKVREYLATKK